MQGDISRWCKECIPGKVSKVTKHTVPKLQEIPVPSRRFTEVNLDIVGPLPPSQVFCYLLTMIDRNTRWLKVTELDKIYAPTVVSGFLRTWISRYEVPVTMVRTAYASLLASCGNREGAQEPEGLPTGQVHLLLLDLVLRSAPPESDAVSSFERTFGVPPILPRDFWGSAETPNNEFLTEFQRAIGASTPPRTLPNQTVPPGVPAGPRNLHSSQFQPEPVSSTFFTR